MATPIKVKSTISVRFPAPIPVADLEEFLMKCAGRGEVTILEIQGGDQRDPYTTSYAVTASWEEG